MTSRLFVKNLMHEGHGNCLFTCCRGDSFDVAAVNVADREDVGKARLEQMWRACQRPFRRIENTASAAADSVRSNRVDAAEVRRETRVERKRLTIDCETSRSRLVHVDALPEKMCFRRFSACIPFEDDLGL